jgi:excisionase family DNA binding protein
MPKKKNPTTTTTTKPLPHYVKPKEACKRLGVSDETLRRWADKGKINAIRSPSNFRLYDIETFLYPNGREEREKKRDIVYCRVSSEKQKKAGDLDRQKEYLGSKYPEHEIVTDTGSGINFKRPGLRRILRLVFEGNVREIVVAHRDRLCRFAFELLEWICERHGTKITVENKMDETPESELAQDLLSIITIFSCRNNGMRRYKKRLRDESHEDKDTSDRESEGDIEEMGRSQSIPLQQSTRTGQKRRETYKEAPQSPGF